MHVETPELQEIEEQLDVAVQLGGPGHLLEAPAFEADDLANPIAPPIEDEQLIVENGVPENPLMKSFMGFAGGSQSED